MRINPPTLFWILVSAILAVDRFLPLMRFEAPWLPWSGAALAALGAGISATGKRHFRRARANIHTFEQPDLLVTDGIYSFTRNPMYLSLILIAAGAALVSGTLAAGLLSVAFALAVRYWYIRLRGGSDAPAIWAPIQRILSECRALAVTRPACRAPARSDHGPALGDSFRNPPLLVGPA